MTHLSNILESLEIPTFDQSVNTGWDRSLIEAISKIQSLEDGERERELLTADNTWTLIAWAINCAVQSVRSDDGAALPYALVGLALCTESDVDERELLRVLPLLSRSAEIVGLGCRHLTTVASAMSDAAASRWISKHVDCSMRPEDAGYEETGKGNEFRYELVGADWDVESELRDFLDSD